MIKVVESKRYYIGQDKFYLEFNDGSEEKVSKEVYDATEIGSWKKTDARRRGFAIFDTRNNKYISKLYVVYDKYSIGSLGSVPDVFRERAFVKKVIYELNRRSPKRYEIRKV